MRLMGLILALKLNVWMFWEKMRELAVDDPRRIFHCFKVGLALTLVSLFYYIGPLYDGVGGTAMWGIFTVIVIFECTVGATLSKGLNRGMATLVAGAFGFVVYWLASHFGEKAEPVVLGISVFFIVSAVTFLRFIPAVKTQFDYGVLIFILTFSLVSISGYRENKLFELAHQRLSTIAIGGFMCIVISIFICPIWAGEELHQLITCNIEKLADSLDGCVFEYFNESASTADNEEPGQKSQAYTSVLINSKATEESLAKFAQWEPPHGRFWFWHPWKQYLKISAAIRCCTYRVEALNGSINSEIKAPKFMKKHISDACMKLSSQFSMVLKELATTTKSMRRSSNIEFLVSKMNCAVEDLRNALDSLPHQLPLPLPPPSIEAMKEKNPCIWTINMPLTEVMPLVVVTSLLIEIAGRIQGVVDAVNELAILANFKPAVGKSKLRDNN
ncbi:aluminum-activated malate transporter 10-like [Magnolia sinica]|uniref:aluminum-activated malate transporter 10-like n=1 Tax=Magnolia sinica TaxID=86752 RepID=UPI00265A4F53|nr:aluminum-activated malate transporter 10-like [Magnolia sinica]